MTIGDRREAEASWPDHGEDLILTIKDVCQAKPSLWSSLVTWSCSPARLAPRSSPTSASAGSGLQRRLKGTDIKAGVPGAFARGESSRLRATRNRTMYCEQEERGRLTTPAEGRNALRGRNPVRRRRRIGWARSRQTPAGLSRERRTARSSPKSRLGRDEQFHSRSERSVRCKF